TAPNTSPQQCALPDATSPQVPCIEAASAVKRGAPSSRTGVELQPIVPRAQVSVSSPLPSRSHRLEPQQQGAPSIVSAQVCSKPAVIAVNLSPSLTRTGSL